MTDAAVALVAGSLKTEFILRGRKHVRAVVTTANLTDYINAPQLGLRSFDHVSVNHFGALNVATNEITIASFSPGRHVVYFSNEGAAIQTMSIVAVGS